MEIIGEMLAELWKIWASIVSGIWSVLPKAFSFFFWLLSGLFILPCLYVAGHLYPSWEKWGEKF